jgi:hypothetical protein
MKMEFRQIAKTMTSKLVVLSSGWALWSFFYRYASITLVSTQTKY